MRGDQQVVSPGDGAEYRFEGWSRLRSGWHGETARAAITPWIQRPLRAWGGRSSGPLAVSFLCARAVRRYAISSAWTYRSETTVQARAAHPCAPTIRAEYTRGQR